MKIITSKLGAIDLINDVDKVKKMFPFIETVHAKSLGAANLIAVATSQADLESDEFKYTVNINGDVFAFNHINEFIKYKHIDKIKVGAIAIVPAQLSVKKIMFKNKASNSLSPYQQLAYDISKKIEENKFEEITEQDALKLLEMGLEETYWCDVQFFDELGLVDTNNFNEKLRYVSHFEGCV